MASLIMTKSTTIFGVREAFPEKKFFWALPKLIWSLKRYLLPSDYCDMILMIFIGRTHGTAAATQCVLWWPPSSLSTPRAWATISPHQGLILAILSCHFSLATPICENLENFLKPRPWGFPGLRPGDRWCLCSRRWRYLAQLCPYFSIFISV